MAETLGSLCDKLTIVKLKKYHTDEDERLKSLSMQEQSLVEEINQYFNDALTGEIPIEKLTFSSNKVYKREGNNVKDIKGSMGAVFGELARVNCELWHEQEKVYEFEKVAIEDKDKVVKRLAILNLERNKCIDEIDSNLKILCQSQSK